MVNIDASKTFTEAAKENAQLSQTEGNVRWIVDDCLTFISREVKRAANNPAFQKYDAIILDPPAFGRGSGNSGSYWKLERDLPILLSKLPSLLSDQPLFVLLTCHDALWPVSRLQQTLQDLVLSPRQLTNKRDHKEQGKLEGKELWLHPKKQLNNSNGGDGVKIVAGKSLHLGQCVRWSSFSPPLTSVPSSPVIV